MTPCPTYWYWYSSSTPYRCSVDLQLHSKCVPSSGAPVKPRAAKTGDGCHYCRSKTSCLYSAAMPISILIRAYSPNCNKKPSYEYHVGLCYCAFLPLWMFRLCRCLRISSLPGERRGTHSAPPTWTSAIRQSLTARRPRLGTSIARIFLSTSAAAFGERDYSSKLSRTFA